MREFYEICISVCFAKIAGTNKPLIESGSFAVIVPGNRYQGKGYYIQDEHITDAHSFKFYYDNDELIYEAKPISTWSYGWRNLELGNIAFYIFILIVIIVAIVMEKRQRKKIKEGDE